MEEKQVLTVSEFVEVVNFTLEDTLGRLMVEGEVGEFKIIHKKWVTFTLKDKESSVNCFMTLWQYRGQIEDGMLVKAVGKPRLRNKGFFSFVLESVTPSGEGALKRAFELLKRKLEAEGLFAPERKRALPRFPQHIALITSREAAAYSDFLKVLGARMGGVTVSFLRTQVQGEDAPRQIMAALEQANTDLLNLDVMVLVRGGGSLEDLQAFNDEQVVRAVASSRTPTVVGIGHERDITLAELAADVRASTPSNAAELMVRSREEVLGDIAYKKSQLSQAWRDALADKNLQVTRAVMALKGTITATSNQVGNYITRLQGFRQRFHLTIAEQQKRVVGMARMLASLSPENTLKRGYSITKMIDGRLVRRKAAVHSGEVIISTVQDGDITSTVT